MVFFASHLSATSLASGHKHFHFDAITQNGTTLVARTQGKNIQVHDTQGWRNIFLKGVNLGTAFPGKWIHEPPMELATYQDWLDKIQKMGANCVRIYPLLDPTFYEALFRFNSENPNRTLWLLQEVWPDDRLVRGNFLNPDLKASFNSTMKNAVDAVHGKAGIPSARLELFSNLAFLNYGASWAFGNYLFDVSPYLIGYLIGRELLPEEVISTNAKNPGYAFQGDYLSAKNASPTENWLAESANFLLSYEQDAYNWQHPVGLVSWPTLDPIEHDSEWNAEGDKSKEYNDCVSIDINAIDMGPKMKGGLFGAYHIYPNYPDFMNNEPGYWDYQDDQGRFLYGGYLKEFMKGHGKYPAIVAEFGLATGMGEAHGNPQGYNHGRLSEEFQGRGLVRMAKAIRKEGYVGAIVFEWMDEWAKQTWLDIPFFRPFERHVLWDSAIDPEENYGLVANEVIQPAQPDLQIHGSGIITQMDLSANEGFLYLDISMERPITFSTETLLIGLDTVDRARGNFSYPQKLIGSPSGLEFIAELAGPGSARFLVTPDYNIGHFGFTSRPRDDGLFETIRVLINPARVTKAGLHIPEHFEEASALFYGDFSDSRNQWYVDGSKIHLRLPWGRLNVTDPSQSWILDDNRVMTKLPGPDFLRISATDGIVANAVLANKEQDKVLALLPGNQRIEPSPVYHWKHWSQPKFRVRFKKSYEVLKRYFQTIPDVER